MISSLSRRPALLGAVISTQAQSTYYGTYLGPSYDMINKLHVNVNKLILSRSNFQLELDALHYNLEILDNQLSQLDSTNETQWTAEMQALQNRLHEFTTKVALAHASQSFGVTMLAGGVVFGTTWAFTKRIPRVRRSIYASLAGLAGGGAAQWWWRNRG